MHGEEILKSQRMRTQLYSKPIFCNRCGKEIRQVPYLAASARQRNVKYYHVKCFPADSRPRRKAA